MPDIIDWKRSKQVEFESARFQAVGIDVLANYTCPKCGSHLGFDIDTIGNRCIEVCANCHTAWELSPVYDD